MSTCCADLLELKSFQEISLIAGKNGLYRQITWPFICTTQTISQWIHGGELLFVTGAGIKSDETSLLQLVQESIEKGISAIVILKGDNYIPTIPDSLIDLANRSLFPLFEMPWTLKLIDVTQEVSQIIINNQYQSKKNVLFLEQLLFSDLQTRDFEELALHRNIIPRPFRFIALIGINSISEDLELIKSEIAQSLKYYTTEISCDVICMGHNNTVICLALADSKNCISNLDDSIIKTFNKLEKRYPHIGLQLGIGMTCHEGDSIQQSYSEAKRVLTLMNRTLLPSNIFHYCDLGIFRLLFEINNTDKIKDYCMKNIGELVEADRKDNSELLKTLHYYLNNNCNLLKTSESLFIHRNTLIYRLNLIRNKLYKNIDDSLVRHELFLSIIAAKFLGLI